MDVAERMRLVKIIEKMEENKEFSKRIGLRDESTFRGSHQESRKEGLVATR